MTFVARLLGQSWAYRLWQAPFAEQKLAPVFAHNDLSTVRRVLARIGQVLVHFRLFGSSLR